MKKLILALLMAGTITTVKAQEPKSILTYGNVSLADGEDSVRFKNINWVANIGVGYQFNEHWTLGLNIAWGQNATRDSSSYRVTENYYRLGPIARYSHYLNNSNIFYWFTQFEMMYEGGYSTNSLGVPAYDKHSGIYANVYPAIGMNMCRGLALNFSIGGLSYMSDKSQNATAEKPTNTFHFTFGNMVNFGISKNFSTGHKMHANHEPGDEIQNRHVEKSDNPMDDDDAPRHRRAKKSSDDDE